MNNGKTILEDAIFNMFLLPADKQSDGIKQIASSISLDKNLFIEYVNELGISVFDYFYSITNSCDNCLLIVLTKTKKQEFQMRLNQSLLNNTK